MFLVVINMINGSQESSMCHDSLLWMIDNISEQIAKYDQGKLTIKTKTLGEKVNQIACNMVTPYYPLLEKLS